MTVSAWMLGPMRTEISADRWKTGDNALTLPSFTVPVEVSLNEVERGAYMNIRFLFLYLDQADFDEYKLTKLFEVLSEEYQDTQFMQISAFSNREMLDRAIYRYRVFCGVVPKERLPAKSGYYWSMFSRRDDVEYFDYTPDPMNSETRRVWFRRPTS
jgi:hypothetical protein